MGSIIKFLKEVRSEAMKVTWPSKQELIGSTIVTIITTVLVSMFIFAVDQALTFGFKEIFSS